QVDAAQDSIVDVGIERILHSGRDQPLAQAFVASEKESLILANRPAYRKTKLVALERRRRKAAIEKVARVQGTVAQELENGAVKLVGSRARHGVDHAAAESAV